MKKRRGKFSFALFMTLLIISLTGCIASSSKTNTNTFDDTREREEIVDPLADITALDLTSLMGNGINLGNTMEAYGHGTISVESEPINFETLWGQPETTPEMLTAMKASGFDSIRIPIAWTNAMEFENGNYTIRSTYLDRVEQIIGYALDADMYVIINDHWDGGWWGMFGSATEETRIQGMDLYVSMWSQIAERFIDYPHKLIFESANEELGNRLNDADVASDSGSLSEDECYNTANAINQAFVDTIRNSGGNNANRFLLIAGYNTDIMKTCDDRFQMPTDTAKNKLLLSVHYYTPWSYCGTDSVTSWGTEKNYQEQNDLLKMMTKFTEQGYGIILGEYGALPKSDSTLKDNTVDFTKNFLDNCDLYGYVPMLWDTSSFFIRTELKITDESLSTLFKERNFNAELSYTETEIKETAKQALAFAIESAVKRDANTTTTDPVLNGDEFAIAWIMFNSNDYALTYSVGDIYDPTSKSEGVIAKDIQITKSGSYTIGLDFTETASGYANSTSFSAIGISNGEILFPNYIISIQEIIINGEIYTTNNLSYTTSDDQICTRLNLYNAWITEIPDEARCTNSNMLPYVSATLLDPTIVGNIETISITFTYFPAK